MRVSLKPLARAMLCAAILFFPPISFGQIKTGAETVRLQLKWLHQFQFAGYYAAKEKGFYGEEGLNAIILRRDPDQNNIRKVIEGKAEYGIADSMLLLYRMRGEPVVLLSPVFQHSPLVYMALRRSGIESPYQIRGKRVMVYLDDTDGLPLAAMRHELGIGPDAFTPVPKTLPPDALENGLVDVYPGYLANETWYFSNRGIQINIIDPRNYGADFYGDMLFTSENEIRRPGDRPERFRRASLKGWEYALENPDEIIDLIIDKYRAKKSRAQLRYEAGVIRRMIQPDFVELGRLDPGRLRYCAKTFKRLGFTDTDEIPPDFVFQGSGTLKLTSEQEAFLRDHPVVRVHNEQSWPPFNFCENGKARGFSIDYMNLLAKKIGIGVTYVSGPSWNEFLTMVRQKELDVMLNIVPTDERRKYMHFSTDAYIETPRAIVIRKNDDRIHGILDLHGKTVAVEKGFFYETYLGRQHPEIKLLPVRDTAATLREVAYGRADATIGVVAVEQFLIKKHFLSNLKMVAAPHELALGGGDQHIGVRRDWPVFAGIMDKAMSSVSVAERMALVQKWAGRETVGMIEFNAEEQQYLKNHPILRVACDKDWPPVGFNEKTRIRGMAADYMRRISEIIGVQFKQVTPKSRSGMPDAVKKGEADFLVAVSDTERHREWLDFTEPYIRSPMVIVTRRNVSYIDDIKGLENRAGGKVVAIAATDGHDSREYLERNCPGLSVLKVKNAEEGLAATHDGKVFAFLGSLASVNHIMGRDHMTGLQVSGETGYMFNICMATRKGDRVLHGLLQKSLAAITREEKEAIYSKWTRITVERIVDHTLIWQLACAALLVFSLIMFRNRRLHAMAVKLKKSREESRKAMEAAEAASMAKSIFLANMSHELRTPMNAILGFSQLVNRDTELSDRNREHLAIIRRNGKHLLTIINDVLDMSKIEAGRTTLKKTNFDLHRMMDDLEDMMRFRAENKSLSLAVEKQPDLPEYVRTDETKLRQVLANLVGNAVKFTEKGGVAVRVRQNESDSLFFEIEDTGPGIAPEDMAILFEPFAQTKTGRKSHEGTGLGLAISKKFVQLMGGEIKVRSEIEKGAAFSFHVRIQIVDTENFESSKRIVGIQPESARYKILIVDDNTDCRKLIFKLLEPFRFKLKEAENGQKALEIWKDWEPDLIWTDIKMPVMDGYEFVQTIREMEKNDPKRAKTPVIAQTASSFEEERQKMLDAGCDGFVRKPFREQEILKTMNEHLDVRLTYETNAKRLAKNSPKPDLATLPQELLETLEKAAQRADFIQLTEVVEKIRGRDEALAVALARLADNFEYDRILALLPDR